ncbi:MAG: hypothetical protein SAL70_15360 [Scytonema sp. PMC 1070.18]|nr:hypothetical protein [Scytonema sp. PMC 1070.18]
MTSTNLEQSLKFIKTKKSKRYIFWLSLSLIVAVVYGCWAIFPAFQHEYIIHDDARQHIFWMQRFVDGELFTNNYITDYFQSISPPGYSAFYQFIANIGIHPFFASKIVPVFLGIVTTLYCYGVCVELLPIPVTGFIGTLLMNQNLWLSDDIISATSRAFLYPLFFAFLYYLLRQSLFSCLVSLAILGLFYPGFVLISVGILILQLLKIERSSLRFSQQRRDYIFCGLGIAVGLAVILPYALGTSLYGPLMTLEEARTLPEFLSSGRMSFFLDDNPLKFWLAASRSGIRISLNPPIIALGILLPVLLRFKSHFPLGKQVRKNVSVLVYLVVVSLFLFFAAHALLFKLYLPSRFTVHSFKIVLVVATAIALTLILDALINIRRKQKFGKFAIATLFGGMIVFYPNLIWKDSFPRNSYVTGAYPTLYQFFKQQPKDILIASLAYEGSNLPSFSQRSILVSYEYAIAYHLGYYRQFRQRLADLIRAEYSPNLEDAKKLIQEYGVDYFLIEKGTFTPEYITKSKWLRQYLSPKLPNDMLAKLTRETLESLQQGTVPALSKVVQDCQVLETGNLMVIEAECVVSPELKFGLKAQTR